MERMPFRVPLDHPVRALAAGEKQKLEILKQLYLGRRFLILDEPTSVLTPDEADEVLGHVRALCEAGEITVLMITHKFREVERLCRRVSVLRRGKLVGSGKVADLSHRGHGAHDDGRRASWPNPRRAPGSNPGDVAAASRACAQDRSGKEITLDGLEVRAGEIVGLAGISGNGQVELMEILTGQRPLEAGRITVKGAPFDATRAPRPHQMRPLPARRAAAKRLRPAHERDREHRLPHLRPERLRQPGSG
jgi:ABC-type uncharacterized transport system ATPase subunit